MEEIDFSPFIDKRNIYKMCQNSDNNCTSMILWIWLWWDYDWSHDHVVGSRQRGECVLDQHGDANYDGQDDNAHDRTATY